MNLRPRPLVAALVLALATFAMLAAPQTANAQAAGNIKRIGYLASQSQTAGFQDQFLRGLRELGWIAGQNLIIEFRFADNSYERLPELAAELVRLNVDVIVAQPTAPAVAASRATRTIPIVMINVGDPVALGLIDSLARPAGNVTGTAFTVGSETHGKGLEVLKESLHNVRRVAVLSNPGNPAQALAVQDLKTAAQPLGLQLTLLEARTPDEFNGAFDEIAKQRAEALFVVPESLFLLHRTRLANLALKHRVPTFYGLRENVEAGGLISFGPSLSRASHRSATFVDKILKGAKPGDLPVEQPAKFEIVVNMKTAKALGLTIPQSILLRADEIIQ